MTVKGQRKRKKRKGKIKNESKCHYNSTLIKKQNKANSNTFKEQNIIPKNFSNATQRDFSVLLAYCHFFYLFKKALTLFIHYYTDEVHSRTQSHKISLKESVSAIPIPPDMSSTCFEQEFYRSFGFFLCLFLFAILSLKWDLNLIPKKPLRTWNLYSPILEYIVLYRGNSKPILDKWVIRH